MLLNKGIQIDASVGSICSPTRPCALSKYMPYVLRIYFSIHGDLCRLWFISCLFVFLCLILPELRRMNRLTSAGGAVLSLLIIQLVYGLWYWRFWKIR